MSPSEWQKRLSIIFMIGGFLFVSLLGRLYQKAVSEHSNIVQAAEHQYAYRKEIIGKRGQILVKDTDGSYFPLAYNERRYQVLAVPINISNPKETAAKLAPVIGVEEKVIFEAINNKKPYVPPLKRRLTSDQRDKVKALKLTGIMLLPELVRTYPEQALASQVLGFVNAEDKGNYGVESAFDSVLRGSTGYQVGEKDNQGRLINVDDEVQAKQGTDIILTIDREIQHFVEKALAEAVKKFEADSGSVVIVEPKTGAIISMAATPTYNPNEYFNVEDQAKFMNPVTEAVWEPGSIAKPLIMALAIDKKLVEPDTQETFGASVKVQGYDIWTAEKKAFGLQTMTQVLENSDNVGMVWVSDKLGNKDEYEGLKNFGVGEVTDLNGANIVPGYLPGLKDWTDIGRANMSFGQGFSSTPLQMAMAYAALANDGVLMQPYLVAEVRDEKGVLSQTQPKEVRRVVTSETAQKVSKMLESVVEHGHAKRAGVSGYRVGGKTGTAQISDPEGGYLEDYFVGSLAGYFPLSAPKYAMVVKLDKPKNVKFAESSAGPTFGEIAKWILIHKQITPDKTQ